MIVVKQIKPARLKEDDMRLALLNGMRKFGTVVKKEYEKTVTTWNQKPKFDSIVSLAGGDLTVVTGVSGGGAGADHWRYVNEGVAARPILPNKAKVLHFKAGFTSKSIPGIISSRAGASFGEDVFVTYVENWPGIKARDFDKVIAKEMEPRFKRAMEQTMRDVAKASGHGMR